MALKLSPETLRANRSLLIKLLAFTAGSFAFGYALVPLYDVLCDITGMATSGGSRRSPSSPRTRTRTASSRSSSSRSCRATATSRSVRCCTR